MSENQKLREALQRYGKHDRDCGVNNTRFNCACNCGLEAALALPTADHIPDAGEMVDDHLPDAGKMIETVTPVGEREAFEQFAQNCPMGKYNVTRRGEGYDSSHTQIMWDAWQSGRAALRAGDSVDGLPGMEPVAWLISVPDEPDLGSWLSEEPGADYCKSEPLCATAAVQQYKNMNTTDKTPTPLKEHEIREVVNTVTATARAYRETQQLRARVADVLVPILRQSGFPGLKWAEIDPRPINAVLVPCDKLKEMQDELHSLRLTANRIQQAITEYHHCLDTRQHGGIAANKLTESIQEIMGMPWIQAQPLRLNPLKEQTHEVPTLRV